ncbi:MAG: hypothetical protein IJA03_11345, partial [Bacteroidaceae bacterium]|nr:hypothetical protein [Bacteroidaceae bacterium]
PHRFQRFQFSVTDFAFQHRSAINIICKDNSLLYYIYNIIIILCVLFYPCFFLLKTENAENGGGCF